MLFCSIFSFPLPLPPPPSIAPSFPFVLSSDLSILGQALSFTFSFSSMFFLSLFGSILYTLYSSSSPVLFLFSFSSSTTSSFQFFVRTSFSLLSPYPSPPPTISYLLLSFNLLLATPSPFHLRNSLSPLALPFFPLHALPCTPFSLSHPILLSPFVLLS